jgi:hypothetical protein
MPKIYLDRLVIATFQRLFGVTAFLEAIDTAIPTLEATENQYLEHLAAQEGWEPSDTAIEKIELDAKYMTWVPTFAAYSIIILLHSIVENQLFALADRLGKKRDAKLRGASEPTHENGLLTVSLGASTHPRIGVHLR